MGSGRAGEAAPRLYSDRSIVFRVGACRWHARPVQLRTRLLGCTYRRFYGQPILELDRVDQQTVAASASSIMVLSLER